MIPCEACGYPAHPGMACSIAAHMANMPRKDPKKERDRERQRQWRANNRDRYRANQRELMRKRRAAEVRC